MNIKQTIWLKTGTLVSLLAAVAGLGAYVEIIPTAYQPLALFVIATAGGLLKLFNPADSPVSK